MDEEGGGEGERNRESSSKVQGNYVIVIRHICKATYSMPVERLYGSYSRKYMYKRWKSNKRGEPNTSKPQKQQPKKKKKNDDDERAPYRFS